MSYQVEQSIRQLKRKLGYRNSTRDSLTVAEGLEILDCLLEVLDDAENMSGQCAV